MLLLKSDEPSYKQIQTTKLISWTFCYILIDSWVWLTRNCVYFVDRTTISFPKQTKLHKQATLHACCSLWLVQLPFFCLILKIVILMQSLVRKLTYGVFATYSAGNYAAPWPVFLDLASFDSRHVTGNYPCTSSPLWGD